MKDNRSITLLAVFIFVDFRKRRYDKISIGRSLVTIPTWILWVFSRVVFLNTSESSEAHLVSLNLLFKSSACNSVEKALAPPALATGAIKFSRKKLERTTLLASTKFLWSSLRTVVVKNWHTSLMTSLWEYVCYAAIFVTVRHVSSIGIEDIFYRFLPLPLGETFVECQLTALLAPHGI